jgi:glycosyltransferase involved in cell wall biosynthesis
VKPLPVSAVIPCTRHDGALERALASALAQTRLPMEIILVNDGGGPACEASLRQLAATQPSGSIVVVSLASNAGPAGARNAGWAVARGEHVAFLDADDAWHPRKLEIQHAVLAADPGIVLCGHRHRSVHGGEPRWTDHRLSPGWRPIGLGRMLLSNPFVTPSVMIRRDVPFRFADGQRYMEDYRLWLAICASGARVVRGDSELACVFKAAYGEGGQSARLWPMQVGETAAYIAVARTRPTLALVLPALLVYSFAKFLRRVLLVAARRAAGAARVPHRRD